MTRIEEHDIEGLGFVCFNLNGPAWFDRDNLRVTLSADEVRVIRFARRGVIDWDLTMSRNVPAAVIIAAITAAI
jgi:hypothetical protein